MKKKSPTTEESTPARISSVGWLRPSMLTVVPSDNVIISLIPFIGSAPIIWTKLGILTLPAAIICKEAPW